MRQPAEWRAVRRTDESVTAPLLHNSALVRTHEQ